MIRVKLKVLDYFLLNLFFDQSDQSIAMKSISIIESFVIAAHDILYHRSASSRNNLSFQTRENFQHRLEFLRIDFW